MESPLRYLLVVGVKPVGVLRDGLENEMTFWYNNEMTNNERIVRKYWEWVTCFPLDPENDTWLVQVPDARILYIHEFYGKTEAKAWHAAAEFTIQRQEEIRRRTIGLGLLKECMPGDGWHSAEQVVIAGEIYTREQAALAELQRGWKGLK